MHFAKTYAKLLLTLPEEITQSSIPYRQLKKLIRAAVDEFSSLGLRAAVPEATANEGPDAPELPEEPSMRTTLVFEFQSSTGRIDHLSLVVTGIAFTNDTHPSPPSPSEANTDTLPDSSASSASFGPQHSDNSSVETIPCTSHPPADAPASISAAFLQSSGLIAANLHLPDPHGHRETVVNLVAETHFYQLLWTTSRALSAHLLYLYSGYCDTLRSLSQSISSSVRPQSSTSAFHPHSSNSDPNAIHLPRFNQKKSDLYVWREIFQLYVELSPFERLSEINRGERPVEEAEQLLEQFVGSVRKAGLTEPPKMKLKQSKDMWNRFMEMNTFILNMKKFQRLSVEATKKILKKHAKRIPLPLPHLSLLEYIPFDPSQQTSVSSQHFTKFSLIPNSASGLTRIMVQAMAETLLTTVPRIDDYTCLICTSIAFKPIRLACGHFFCVRCLVKMQRRGQANCPMCRAATVLVANRTNVDWALVNFMEDWFPIEARAKHDNNVREASEEQIRGLGYDPNRCLIA